MLYEPLTLQDNRRVLQIAGRSPFTRTVSHIGFSGPDVYRGGRVLGARDEAGEVCAYLIFTTPAERSVLHIAFVGVDAAFQGRGIGWELIRYAAAGTTSSTIDLVCDVANQSALGFYARYGFQVVRSLRGWPVLSLDLDPFVLKARRSDRWVPFAPAALTIATATRAVIAEAAPVSQILYPFATPQNLTELRRRFPAARLVGGQVGDAFAAERPGWSWPRRLSRAWGAFLGFNHLTLRNLAAGDWKVDLIDSFAARRPRWMFLNDTSGKYLHLNYRAYGLAAPDRDRYREAFQDFVARRWAYRCISFAAHNASGYYLFGP
jgi:ribosomal protein S18 acetylase RimI-like enzyme